MLAEALSVIVPKTILVVGDLILDQYTYGEGKRISPEAPVPVIVVDHEETKAGGAGNVALNLVSMGMRTRLLGRVGADSPGRHITMLLAEEGVDTSGITEEEGFETPTKIRIIASSQQLLRIDREKPVLVGAECEKAMIETIPRIFEGVDLVAISDYAKGTLSLSVLSAVIRYARSHNIPCITDPKGTDFRKYAGSTILKPNATETLRAAPPHASSSLEEAARALIELISVDVLMVTRSEEGISLFFPDGRAEHFPVQPKEVRDVTGAGDTVLAMLSAAYASGVPLSAAVSLSNVAASCAVERLGCARVSLRDVASLLIEQNPSGKICSAETFFSLVSALPQEKLLMIRMPSCCSLSSDHLLRLSEIASFHKERRVIACFENASPDPRLLELVASLSSMHLVVHGVTPSLFGHNLPKDHVLLDLS